MTEAHNVLIRGLNSIVQQAPYVRPHAQDGHKPQDVKDLLFYVKSWAKMVNHHHWVEESFIFPEVDKFTNRPGFMDDPRHQHELFHDGLQSLLAYAESTPPSEYRWHGAGGMQAIVDSFAQSLTDHLHAEIDILMALKDTDSARLRELWDKAEGIAKQKGNLGMLYDVFPCVLGAADKTYEGGTDFPPLPVFMPYAIQYWFAAGNGAWRFNPCTFWGQPQPLEFGPAV